ncbi:MAG: PP2C family protein-serine/threonine phosphatase [Candidatus Acidiferrales bacterium]
MNAAETNASGKGQIQSPAFRRAALESERLRIRALVSVLLVLIATMVARVFLVGDEAELQTLPKLLTGAVIFLGYEILLLRVVSRWLRSDREPPGWVWIANVAVEAAFPTWILVLLTDHGSFGPYRALVTPAMLLFFIFIILSTLRLNPWLCGLTGLLSALGYAGVLAYTLVVFPEPPEASGAFPPPIYATYSVLFLVGGLAAGGVALRVRAHVLAALREAEARRQVDQMKHDLHLARTIQEGLLPKTLPELPGYDIAGWSQPADETGGDYYDWQSLPDGRLAISLADVTGHGIASALVTAACRAYSRASFPSGGELGSVMTRINALLAEDLPANRFVTFVVALLDPRTNRMELLSAGHGPILVYKASENRLYEFPAQGIPFGITSTFEYGSALALELSPRDFVMMLTDGFFEWAGPDDEQFGLERLNQAVHAAKDLSAQQLIATLYAEVEKFARGTKQQDDLTAVVVKHTVPF